MESYCSWEVHAETLFDVDGCEYWGEEYALITKLWVAEKDRSKGLGRKLLREAIAEIESEHPGMKIVLVPIAEGGLDQEQLADFYASEGFDENADGTMSR